jgi:hypothetical protein
MSPTPVNGEVPAQFLTTLAGSTAVAELNTAAAYGRLKAAHPGVYCDPPAGAYWTRALDEAIHANPAAYGVTDKNLSPIGASPHGLGTRLNIENVTPAVAAQFGFSEFNAYTFTYTGTPSWDQVAVEHNLTVDEVKRVASYLNGRSLGRYSTASETGLNILPGLDESNYYWEVQRAGKLDGVYPAGDLLNGIPGPATYAAELHYRDLTAPAATPVVPPAPVAVAPAPVAAPGPVTAPAPATPGPSTTPPPAPAPAPVQKAPTVTAPKPLTSAQKAADVAKLNADAASLGFTFADGSSSIDQSIPTAPLAGLLAGKVALRKRVYVAYAATALVISCGSDVVTYGLLSAHASTVLVTVVGLSTSVLLKVGAAFGLVAASNTK